jgi:hypothetical protein
MSSNTAKHRTNKKDKIMRLFYKVLITAIMQNDDNIETFLKELDEREGINSNSISYSNSKSCLTKKHFIDKFININKPIINDEYLKVNSTTKDINKNINDNKKKESLSLRKIAINFQLLSNKINLIKNMILNLISIINWEKSDKTIVVLLLYTWACIYPYFFLLYPIIYLLYVINIKYLEKHPIIDKPSMETKNNESINNWENGLGIRLKDTKSAKINGIFGFLFDYDNNINTLLDENENENENGIENENKIIKNEEMNYEIIEKMIELIQLTTNEGDDCEYRKQLTSLQFRKAKKEKEKEEKENDDDEKEEEEEEEEEKREKVVYKNFILKSLLDIQIQTSQILEIFDNLTQNFNESCGFIEEKNSTILVYKLFFISLIGLILGKFIPWKAIFIVLVWIIFLMNHPLKRQLFEKLKENSDKEINQNKDKAEELGNIDLFLQSSIIIDERVFVREVEVFEIEQIDMLKLNEYKFFGFSNSIFNISDEIRLKRKKPNLVYNIKDILPPNNKWEFLNGEDWDLSDTKWIENCKYYNEFFLYDNKNGEGWIYDINKEFRRRRWIRKIIQR